MWDKKDLKLKNKEKKKLRRRNKRKRRKRIEVGKAYKLEQTIRLITQ
jgi:hypothetical protein